MWYRIFSTKTIIANEANGDGSSMTWQRMETAVDNSSSGQYKKFISTVQGQKDVAIGNEHTQT